jgi:aminopeptidase N
MALTAVSAATSSTTQFVQLPLPDRSFLTESEHAHGHIFPDGIPSGEGAITSARSSASYGYDVDHVDLQITPDLVARTIDAMSTLSITMTEAGRTSIDVDLRDALTVTAVLLDGVPTTFAQSFEQVEVSLPSPSAIEDQHEVHLSYNGRPAAVGNKSMRWLSHSSTPIMYTLSTPYSTSSTTVIPISHLWRPCKDVPNDKSTYSCALTVPADMTGVSNGLLTSTVDHGNGTKTFHWEHNFPVAPYLITVAVTNFVEIQDEYVGDGGSSPIRHYAWPEDLADATSDWSVTVPQMEVLAEAFGEYPFLGDKFGNYETTSGPAVEHQTAVSTPNSIVTGNGIFDWINVHEIAHMWFGDCLTVADWDHVWLAEGAASYSEAIWRDSIGGPGTLRDYMLNMDSGPYAGTVVAPPYVWNSIVYDKGAWIFHMLRHILGDATFFQTIQDYHATHAYGNVVTSDLIAATEAAYGGSMDWFFDPWIYETGRPDYLYEWSVAPSATGGMAMALFVEQVQSESYPTYTMPIDVVITTASGSETVVVMNSQRREAFSIPVAEMPISVALDPDDWILADFTEGEVASVPGDGSPADGLPGDGSPGAPSSLSVLAQNAPNPVSIGAQTEIRFSLSRQSTVALRIFDVSGRLVRTLVRGSTPAGEHTVSWDVRDNRGTPVAAGTYFYQLVGPSGIEERSLVVTP